MKNLLLLFCLVFYHAGYAVANDETQIAQGKKLYEARCMICHGKEGRATGPLAQKSNPPTPDLTSCAYQRKLAQCPGRMVASIVLTPGGDLIPKTLQANGIYLPPHVWTDQELRAINEYLLTLIANQPQCVDPQQLRMHHRSNVSHDALSL